VADTRAWIKKTAFPESKGSEFDATKCIIVVKNPFHLVLEKFEEKIQSTNTSLALSLIKTNEQLFNTYINAECEMLTGYLNYWFNVPIPYFVLRVEDLIFDPEQTILNLFSFLLNADNLKGSTVENKMLMFLKYNKFYTTLLEHEFKNEKDVYTHYNNLQKNMLLRLLKDELIKLGYISPQTMLTLKDKKVFDENDFQNLVDTSKDSDFWFKESNNLNVKKVIENSKKKSKYSLFTSMKINTTPLLTESE